MVIGNIDHLYYAAAIAIVVLLIGTPLFWRMAAALPRGSRVLFTSVACFCLSGLIALTFRLSGAHNETVMFALLFSFALQLIAMPILALLPRRA
ncbi:MAG: hypothetical protein V4653_09815 [Pseudomonadota bacterium]